MSLFEKIGGRATLEKVHKHFYDRLFNHPQLAKFFVSTPQKHQENQQSDFMSAAMGGPDVYFGKEPHRAHLHLFVTDEIFSMRHEILNESLIACGVPEELRIPWLKIDSAFKHHIVKKSMSECVARYADEGIVSIDLDTAKQVKR